MTVPDLVSLARQAPVHFMGIGGAGMSPLAEMLLRSGGAVSGCDPLDSPTVDALRSAGATIATGHDPAHLTGCSAMVVTAAVRPDHPEIAAARAAGLPVLKRAEALGSLVNRGVLVGIAGTHGKTSTTAMTTAVLTAAGQDPTGFVGGRVPGWGGGLRLGSDRTFVVEADEYDRSFLHLRPTVAVITTLEADHLDIYGTLEQVEDAFADYTACVVPDGVLVGCGDDAGVARLLGRVEREGLHVIRYGTELQNRIRAERVQIAPDGARFGIVDGDVQVAEVHLGVPGLHNVRNALAAAAVGRHLGASWDSIAAGLSEYGGVERRFERVGEAGGVLVIDDYAHHPTEVEATLVAARAAYPARRMIAAFQPHLYSRTRDFAGEFGRALARADRVVLTDVYAARELPIPGVTGTMIADEARASGAAVRYVPARADLVGALLEEVRPGDLCVTLGAGDLNVAARDLLSRLDRGDD